jgi:4-hydroxy-4-methyl-2-oxoglutarate aldolase
LFQINDMPEQVAPALLKELEGVCVSTLGHLRDHGFALGLVPNRRPIKVLGTAVTVRIPHLDSTAVHLAVDYLRPGDVLVVDQSGDRSRSCFGGLVSFTAKARGAAGAVIDGAINDHDETQAYDFPVYSRGYSPLTTRIGGIEGAINVPVSIAGAVVRPGDLVFGDSDGVAFLAPEEAVGLGALLRSKEEAEAPAREKIAAGGSIAEFSGAIAYHPGR